MDMEELWSKTREVLRAEVNAVVYNSLLGSNNLVPALLDGDTLVLRVVMDNLKLLITNQWYSTIVRALSQVAGHQPGSAFAVGSACSFPRAGRIHRGRCRKHAH